MLYGEKNLYEQTRSLKKGEGYLPPFLESFRRRVSELLGIKILNVVYDSIDIGPSKGRPRLNVIVDTEDDYKRFHEDHWKIRAKSKEIILKTFFDTVNEMGLHAEFETKNVLLISDDFSDEAMNQAAFKLFDKDKKSLIKEFSADQVWDITGMSKHIVVFFLDENAKNKSLANGSSNQIRQRCYEKIKLYDEFNYFAPENFSVTFDSKENLDKNYEGSLFYYFR